MAEPDSATPAAGESSAWRRWAQAAGVDRAVGLGVLSIALRSAAGPVTAFLIALHFTPETQGYHYTFASVVALQVLIELGLGQVLVQFASHEAARLSVGDRGRLQGDPAALSRLVSLGRLAFAWYLAGGVLLILGLAGAGLLFFRRDAAVSWTSPWLALCVTTGLRFPLLACWSLLEGCNQVARLNAYRSLEALVSIGCIWIAILSGAGLWTAVAGGASGVLLGLLFLSLKYPAFFAPFLRPPAGERIDWRREVWPMQWRLALSWLAGYLSFSLFTPVLYRTHGAVVAGQMGMTWSFVGAISAVASAWINTKVPTFGRLIAERRYADLDRLYTRSATASFLVALGGGGALFLGVWFFHSLQHPLSARLLPPLSTGLLVAATVLLQVSIAQASYLRAHKKEPFLGLSLSSGLLIGASTIFLGSRFGPSGMGVGYLAVMAGLIVPLGTVIWFRKREAWHRGAPGDA